MSKTNHPLQIVIVGGGLCGLSTALSLSLSGHHVMVLESRSGPAEIGAGIQVQPNASRIMISWGLKDAAERLAEPAMPFVTKRWSGETIAEVNLERSAKEFPTWLIHRYDLQRLLLDAAIHAGTTVRFGSKAVMIDPNIPSVACENGMVVSADLLLLADGIGSRFRGTVINQDPEPIVRSNAYRLIIPREAMMNHSETAALMKSPLRMARFGPRRNIISYPISRGRYYNVVMEREMDHAAAPGVWNKRASLDEVHQVFEDFEPIVHRIIERATSCVDWTLGRLPALPSWRSSNGRTLLIGDSAHATTPHLAQGGGMAIEDAAVLTECLASLVHSVEDFPLATRKFQDLRKERCEYVQDVSWSNSFVYNLPDGPEQELRDRGLREAARKAVQTETTEERSSSGLDNWKPETWTDFLTEVNAFDAIAGIASQRNGNSIVVVSVDREIVAYFGNRRIAAGGPPKKQIE